jgi:hypothetical protein
LCQKFPKAQDLLTECRDAFQALNATTDPRLSKAWGNQERKAQADRIARPNAMLIYDVQLEKGEPMHCSFSILCTNLNTAPTKAEILLTLMEAEVTPGRSGSMVAWIAEGFKIEESQYDLMSYVIAIKGNSHMLQITFKSFRSVLWKKTDGESKVGHHQTSASIRGEDQFLEPKGESVSAFGGTGR